MAESAPTTFRCRCCGEDHPGPPLSWAMEAPDEWVALTPSERRAKGDLSSDQCIIDPNRYFVRGSLELPVLDDVGPFVWDIWVSLSETTFKRASERWHDPGRTEEPPYFGWLCNSLPGYPETLSLKREGITMARVIEIAEIAMHHNSALPPDRFHRLKRILRKVLS